MSSPELNQQIVFWYSGSLMRTTLGFSDAYCGCHRGLLRLCFIAMRETDLFTFGRARARSLGVNINRLRIKTLVLVAFNDCNRD